MTEKDTKAVETVSKADFDKVSADLAKANAAIQKLITAMAQRYAQDLYREVMGE